MAEQTVPKQVEPADDKVRYSRPSEKRALISEEGRKWQEENSESAKAWAEWVEKNGLPLRPLF